MSGNLVITHKGTLTVRAHQTGHAVVMHFKEPSMFSSKKAEKHEVHLFILSLLLSNMKTQSGC